MSDGFRTVGYRTVASTPFLRLDRLHLTAPDGTPMAREVVRHPGAVAVVPIVDGCVVLIRQYRAPIDAWVLEIPAGKLDVPGEDQEAAAARELEEEVGLTPGQLQRMVRFVSAPGFSDEWLTLFLATGCRPVPVEPDGPEEELAEIVRLPLEDIPGVVASGQIEDAKTLIGLLTLLTMNHGDDGSEPPA